MKAHMDSLRELQEVEYLMDEVVYAATGGDPDNSEKGWCPDWSFDTYDSSVELKGVAPGVEPSAETLARFHEAGIRAVFVSYTDGTGRLWYFREGTWRACECSTRPACSPGARDIHERRRRCSCRTCYDPVPVPQADGAGQ